jgi:hypothetical protein
MSAEEACALLGLYLRAHNDFTVRVQANLASFIGFQRFYRGCASSALPYLPDWLGATWAAYNTGGESRPFTLLRAVAERLGRALVARDYIEVRIRHWQPDEAWDEVLYFFEALLLSIGGALDALARALDAALTIPETRGGVGFRKGQWRAQLLSRAPRLEEVLRVGSEFRAVVDAIAVLRNFIHEDVLSSELFSKTGPPEIIDHGYGVLALRPDTAAELCAAVAVVGGAAAWGVEPHRHSETTVMPVLFARAATARVLGAIREIMATAVIPDLAPEAHGALSPRAWLPAQEHRPRLLLLGGVTDGQESLVDVG